LLKRDPFTACLPRLWLLLNAQPATKQYEWFPQLTGFLTVVRRDVGGTGSICINIMFQRVREDRTAIGKIQTQQPGHF
jgi:hypothetical protein